MENKHYKIREDRSIEFKGRTLYRIEALEDLPQHNVKKGDIGGFVESYNNLVGTSWIGGDAKVYGNAKILLGAFVYGDAKVFDNAQVWGNAQVFDNADVFDNAQVYGNAEVRWDAQVSSMSDYIVFKNFWSSGRYFTWTRSNNLWSVGCFHGTGEELIEKAYKDSKESGDNYKAIVDYVNNIVLKQ